MPVLTWLRGLLAPRPRRRTTAPRPAFRPCVEQLEDRLTPSGGLLDPTFGTGGSIIENDGFGHQALADVTVLSDGKLLAAGRVDPGASLSRGSNFAAVRYNADGTRDASFGTGGLALVDFTGRPDRALAVAVQPGTGGKILVAGTAFGTQYEQFGVVRLNANGTLDTSFGPKASKGEVTVSPLARTSAQAYSMAVLADGKFVLAGVVRNLGTAGRGSIALARFNANGTLDTTFGTGGTVVTALAADTTNSGTHPVNVAVDGSGRLVVTGTDSVSGASQDFLLARFNANGSLDMTFGGAGVVRTDLASGSSDRAIGLALQGDGKVLVVGVATDGTNPAAAVVRYDANGSLDSTFGVGGVALIYALPSYMVGHAAAVQPDGKILVAGVVSGRVALVRLDGYGNVDTSHGPAGTGIVMTSLGYGSQVGAMALQTDGRAVVVGVTGTATPNNIQNFSVTRFLGSSVSPSPVHVGAFTADDDTVVAGSLVTLTAGNITTANAGATVTKVAFYYVDANGVEQFLGYAAPAGGGTWALTFTASLPPGSYTLLALAVDSTGAVSDPVALNLDVL